MKVSREADAGGLDTARHAIHFTPQLCQVDVRRRLDVGELTSKLQHQFPQRQQSSVVVGVVLVKRLHKHQVDQSTNRSLKISYRFSSSSSDWNIGRRDFSVVGDSWLPFCPSPRCAHSLQIF